VKDDGRGGNNPPGARTHTHTHTGWQTERETSGEVGEGNTAFSWTMCDDFERLLRSQTSRVTSLQGEAETKEGHHARVDKENDGRRQALRKIAECIAVRSLTHSPPHLSSPLPPWTSGLLLECKSATV
jgi:hypothetical protein